jgi:CSLREA domain-containing protein
MRNTGIGGYVIDSVVCSVVRYAVVALLGGLDSAHAASIAVDTTADDTAVNGNCTLREAVIAANTDSVVDACPAGSGADVISVPAGTYLLTLVGAGEDAAATGDLDLTADVDIQGAGAASTIVDGNLTDRVFDFDPAASGITARLASVTVRNGAQVDEGGGIRNRGTLTLEESAVTNNAASSNSIGLGGGIRDSGNLTVMRSTVTDNTVDVVNPPITSHSQGGGIYSDGSAVIIASTIDGNTADTDFTFFTPSAIEGGGIFSNGSLDIRDSTISHNVVSAPLAIHPRSGGISCLGCSLSLTNSTISGNVTTEVGPGMAIGSGAGLGLFGGTAAISNSTFDFNDKIIQNQAILYSDISLGGAVVTFRNSIVFQCEDFFETSTVTADAHNIVFSDYLCGFSGCDLVATDPQIGPLQDNGGPTFTHAPLPGSAAIDGGDSGIPGSGGTTCEASDQRGVSRPQRVRCDIGSLELDPCPPLPLAGCAMPAKSLLLIKDRHADGAGPKDKLTWKWLKGPAAVQADFGDPTATTNYTLCLYHAFAQSVVLQAFIPASGTCGSLPCWKAIGSKGYSRTDPAASSFGVSKVLLKGGPSSKIIVKGKESSLDLDPGTLPLADNVTVQLSNSANGNCWQSTFATAAAKKNTPEMFKAKTP